MKARSVAILVTAAVMFSLSASAQDSEALTKAKKQLEEYRLSKVSTWINDFAELGRYHDANAALLSTEPAPGRVVFMGDSITDGWPIAEYFPDKPYVNRGISGQTTPQMLIRFRPDVVNLKPKVVVILAGTNDIAGNTGPMTVEQIEDNYSSMAELAKANNIRVVFSSVLPVNNYTEKAQPFFLTRSPEKILALNKWLKAYCETNGHVYLDYFTPMKDEKGLLKKDLAEDGLHPNKTGYKMMAPLAEAAIQKAMGN
ncbi:MAG TPA: SGNH/GDSL hydrolase family protein [Terriglobales bacterium]|jgi:lysophospholipase L1-like esterase|nr:SGNH/GDSL hydrolase family protein [Terriglobales bacterium]